MLRPRGTLAALALTLLSVLAISFGLAPGSAEAARPPKPTPTPTPTTPPATGTVVMLFNIQHGESVDGNYNLQAVADKINGANPTFALLQEVDRRWDARSNNDDQPALLAQKTGMNACYGPNLTNASGGNYGNLILSKLPILSCTNTLLPKFNSTSEQRGLVEITVSVGGVTRRVYNTHLQPNYDDRVVQVNAIVARTDSQPELKVLGGDFNVAAGAPELQPLYQRFTDVWQVKGVGNGYTYPSTGPTSRIDIIFVSPTITVNSASLITTNALISDHLAVKTDVTIP